MKQPATIPPADAATEPHAGAAAPPNPPNQGKPRSKAPLGSELQLQSLNPTPAMRQYLEQKSRVGDAILFFRMGDFYETFYEDAKTIARVLGLTLTARDKNSANPVPLAGVPFHAVDRYVARLVRAGYKVAMSEQMEDPKLAKGVVQRDIVRIITPGTLTDETLLDENKENLLAALCPSGKSLSEGLVGLACVELSSGRFFAEMVAAERLEDELARLDPAELIVPETAIDEADPILVRLGETLRVAVTKRPRHAFDPHMARLRLCEHFQVATLAGFGFDRFDASLSAAAAVLDYLKDTQKTALSHILKIVPRNADESVMIDQVTLRSLEVERTLRDGSREGSLLGAIDMTVNPMGARRLRDWLCYPLRDVPAILARQQAITDLADRPDKLASIRALLKEMGDLERILARVGVGRASPRDLVGLGSAILLCDEVILVLESQAGVTAVQVIPGGTIPNAVALSGDLLETIRGSLTGLTDLGRFLARALKADAAPVLRDGGVIADGYSAELDRLRSIGRDGAQWLAEYQARECQRTGISTLKIDYNSVFGYYIEITHQHRDKIPPEYVRKQTVRNAERYITDELKRYENEALGAVDCGKRLEIELFNEIRGKISAELPRLQVTADALAMLDVLAGLSELSRRRDYCRPQFEMPNEKRVSGLLQIVDGRHPVLDTLLAERFVPNDCSLSSEGDRLLVITGPNMAGKSTYIRQVALLALLAHTGSYVPAKSMRLSPVDRIFARVGASDELSRGQSTFMVEMVETARILNNASPQSLVILDEIGRGTSTYDGLAIAWAITEYLVQRVGCRGLFATHYHELTELADQLAGAANHNVAVREQLRPDGAGRDVVFLHKIVPGSADRSYGVHVGAMAGLPPSVVKRSEAVLEHLESSFSRASHSKGMASALAKDADQMLLFQAEPSLPDWWKDLTAALNAVDVDRTAPLDALVALQRLKGILRDKA